MCKSLEHDFSECGGLLDKHLIDCRERLGRQQQVDIAMISRRSHLESFLRPAAEQKTGKAVLLKPRENRDNQVRTHAQTINKI